MRRDREDRENSKKEPRPLRDLRARFFDLKNSAAYRGKHVIP